jgi:flagellar basal body rod protein FlgC
MRTSVMGVSFLTRRMNVIAEPLQNKDEVQVAESDSKLTRKHPALEKKDEKKADEKKAEEKKVEEKKLDDQKVEEKKPQEKLESKPTTAPAGESK